MKIEFNEKTEEWEVLPPHSKEGIYTDGNLFKKINNIKMIQDKGWDCVINLDGIEGSGKSTLGLTIGWILSNKKITINNIAEGTLDATKKLQILPDKSILIIDEGSLLFSSKEVMKQEQIRLIKILNVIRQKQMILIIISPSFFDLNKYISVHRSRFLLHVYTDRKLTRGFFAYFGTKKKRILYEIGKRNYNSYSKPRSDFRGRFTDFKLPFHEQYLETKKRSLFEAFNNPKIDIELSQSFKKKIYIEMLKEIDNIIPPLLQKQKAQLLKVSRKTLYTYEKGSVKGEE